MYYKKKKKKKYQRISETSKKIKLNFKKGERKNKEVVIMKV